MQTINSSSASVGTTGDTTFFTTLGANLATTLGATNAPLYMSKLKFNIFKYLGYYGEGK